MSAEADDDTDTDAYPPGFETWDRDRQRRHVSASWTRAGLMAGCVAYGGARPDEDMFADDRRLRTEEVATIYLAALAETGGAISAGPFPPEFGRWDRDQQIHYLSQAMSRRAMLAQLLNFAGFEVEAQSLRDDRKLRKNELAGIYLLLEGKLNE